MTTTRTKIRSGSLQAALAAMALAAFSISAHAAESNEITVYGSTTKTVGYDYATNAPIQESTVKIKVSYDPATLTTDSGVAALKASVVEAANKACDSVDSLDQDGTCVPDAVNSAQAQIADAITRARGSTGS